MTRSIKPSRLYDCYQNNKYIMTGTVNEIGEHLGKDKETVRRRIDTWGKDFYLTEVGRVEQAYVLYDDEVLIADGTLESIAKQMHMSIAFLRWHLSPQARDRNISKQLVILEGETVRARHNTFDRKAYKRAEIDERERKKKIKYVKARKAEFKPSEHVRYLHNQYFRKWGIEA